MSLINNLTVIAAVFYLWFHLFGFACGNGLYSIVAPGAIVPNRDFKITVAVYQIQEPVTIKVGITGPSYNASQEVELQTSQELKGVTFQVPDLTKGAYSLTAEGISGLKFHDSIGLYFKRDDPVVFILLDKNHYRPGDRINYRVLVLNEQLRPDLYADDLVICLLDPKRIVVDKAKNSKVVDGVYSGNFQLSKKAALGQWELSIQDSQGEEYRADTSPFTFFEVIPDEVPRFSIQLDAPKYVSIQDDEMKIVVIAKHSYGSPVNGEGIINVNFKTDEKRNHLLNKTLTAKGVLVKGQVVFNINLTDVAKHISPIKSIYLATINATVKDDITGEEISKVSKVYILSHRHIITCADYSCLRPWKAKDNNVFIKIANLDGSLVNDTQSVVKLIYSEGTEKVQPYFRKYVKDDGKKNVYEFVGHLDKSGLYIFKANLSDLPQTKENKWPYYDISAEYKGERYELEKTVSQAVGFMIDAANAYFTPRIDVNFYLQIHGPKDSKGLPAALSVGDEFLVTVNSKEPIKYFIYNIVARGLILHIERVELPEPKMVYNFTLKATHLFSPHFYIYAYFVDEEGILQYTNTQYIVTVSLPNEISISAPNTGYPGEEIELKIKTEPDSFVGVLALNEKISDLSNYRIDISGMDEHLRDYHLHTYKQVPGSNLGLITMTNAKIEGRQFRPFDIDRDVSARKRFVRNVKSLGPPLDPLEIWLFTDIKKTSGEMTELVTKLPDSLGTWEITGISLHPDKGLGVFQSNVTKIKALQPYSVSMPLPISVKFGESINVPVVIVNHLPDPLKIEIVMDKETYAYEIEEFGARSVDFEFCPKWVGYFPLDFTIISSAKNTTVDKSLRVTSEGNTQYRNRAILINLRDNEEFNSSFHIDFPKEIILDSDYVGFSLFGDPLGPILSNLDNSLPSGSGELTMSKMVINFLVWDYLKGNKKLDDDLDIRIQNNLREGYQNILNYRHKDGSFSYFGPPTGNGSIWLTSYVVRYLTEIKKIIYIDDNVLTTGFKFLLSRQKGDGSFTEDFEYFAEADRPVFFTASVLLGLQKQDHPNMEAINKAVGFLRSQMAKTNNLQLPKSIAIYAIQKLKTADSASFAAELKSLSKQEEDRIWWAENVQKPSHQDIEITSYALLSLMESEQILAESAINTVRWLLAQRNTDGEFASSQQTVVGLTALIMFAEKFGYKADGWVLSISNEIRFNKLVIRHDTKLISQSVGFSSDTRYVEIQAKGTGAVLIQISHQYDLEEKKANPSYRIQTTIKPRTSSSKLELNVCVDFVEKSKLKKSGMAILEVSLPSGYISDKSSYKQILDIERVRFVDTKNEKTVVMVYFENLTKNEMKCIPVEAYRAFVVTNLKPSKILIYDNYGRKSTENYQVESELTHV